MSYIELKKLIYLAQTAFGFILWYLAAAFAQTDDPAQLLGSWVMVFIGSGLIAFGILTFALKDDPDVWR